MTWKLAGAVATNLDAAFLVYVRCMFVLKLYLVRAYLYCMVSLKFGFFQMCVTELAYLYVSCLLLQGVLGVNLLDFL